MSIDQLFRQHPRSLGESYFEHQQHALRFGLTLVLAGAACMLHALIPALFTTTASSAVTRLHERMVANKRVSRGARNVIVAEPAGDSRSAAPRG
jgi:hypothetical protein